MNKEELEKLESSQRQHHEVLLHQEKMYLAMEQLEYNLFATLKPRVYIDGNQYCVLLGKDLQEGIAGFGDTIYKAILDFNQQFHLPIKKNLAIGPQEGEEK